MSSCALHPLPHSIAMALCNPHRKTLQVNCLPILGNTHADTASPGAEASIDSICCFSYYMVLYMHTFSLSVASAPIGSPCIIHSLLTPRSPTLSIYNLWPSSGRTRVDFLES